MNKQEEKHQVNTTLKNGEVHSCVYPSYERAKQAAEFEPKIWRNFKSVEIIKV